MTAAILLGAIVAVLAGCLLDVGGDWEGTAATGFLLAIVGGPFWIAQFVYTLLATLDGATPWLWAWILGAPVLGTAVRQSLPSKG